MSMFFSVQATCDRCGTGTSFRLAASVNADRRPDLRQAIMDGTFQAETCPGCGAALRLPLHLSYLDLGRGQWVLAEHTEALPVWREAEQHAREVFEGTYGKNASGPAQELGTGLRPRLVFGWAAFRELLQADLLGLDAVGLELLKLVLLRTVPNAPIAEDTELRLIGGAGEMLEFLWVEGRTEKPLTGLSVSRETYDAVEVNAPDWAKLRRELRGALFVDYRRLFMA
jgi:hypothetical protein